MGELLQLYHPQDKINLGASSGLYTIFVGELLHLASTRPNKVRSMDGSVHTLIHSLKSYTPKHAMLVYLQLKASISARDVTLYILYIL